MLIALARRKIPFDRICAALFGVVWFVVLTDVRVLDPRRVDLVSAGDVAYHAIARNFSQWDAWHWPLTRIGNYLWPVGTSTVYTDTNPWLTLLTKALLPADLQPIQLIGPWLAFSFAAQGWCGAKLARRVTKDRIACALAGAFFTLSPVLTFRMAHDTLCAHALILLALDAAWRPRSEARSALVTAAWIATFSAGLHPTLFAMLFPLLAISLFRHARASRVLVGVALLGPIAVWVAFGTFAGAVQRETFGFGYFSANILSLVDPWSPTWSRVLPPLPHGPGQYEGFGYLGIGAIGMVVVALLRRRRPPPATIAIAAVCSALAVFAFSSKIMFGTHRILDVEALYVPFHAVTNAFRSSGRFIWPLTYFVTTLGVFAVLGLGTTMRRGALMLAIGAQTFDLHDVDQRGVFTLVPPPPASPIWSLARHDYRALILDPPVISSNGVRCEGDDSPDGSFTRFAIIAAREHLVFDSGQAARVDAPAVLRYCAELADARRAGRFDPDAIYVPSHALAAELRARSELTCGTLDGYDVCVRRDRPTAFARALAP